MIDGFWAPGFAHNPSLKAVNYSDSSLRVETLSFEEAADFNPQEWLIQFMTIRLGHGPPDRAQAGLKDALPARAADDADA